MSTAEINKNSLIKEHWSEQEKQNAEATLVFVQTLMNNHDLKSIKEQYKGINYQQHNRSMKDGINGVIEYFQTLTKQFPDFAYEVKSVYVDGDHVIVHSHATMKKKHRGKQEKGFNIIDTWRVENGKLVEHWDAIQPLDNFMRLYYWMSGGSIKNNNGLF